MFAALYAFAAATGLGVVAWAFGIDPKIERVNTKIDAKVELYEEKYDGLKELIMAQFAAMNARLDRVDRSLNGRLRD